VKPKKRICKDGTVTYLIKVYLGRKNDGTKVEKSEYFKPDQTLTSTEMDKAAEDEEVFFRNSLRQDGPKRFDKMTFEDYYDEWKTNGSKNLTESQRDQYIKIIDRVFMPVIGVRKGNCILTPDIQNIVLDNGKKKRSRETMKRYRTIVSSVFSYAVQQGYISENPAKKVVIPKDQGWEKVEIGEQKEEAFSDQEALLFLSALYKKYKIKRHRHTSTNKKTGEKHEVNEYEQDYELSTQWKLLFTLAISTGCRRSELLALTFDDFDLKRNVVRIVRATADTEEHGQIIKVPKTSAGYREVPIIKNTNSIELLKQWKKEMKEYSIKIKDRWKGKDIAHFGQQFLFIQEDGTIMDLHTPTHKFKDFLDIYNRSAAPDDMLPRLHFHSLRHTYDSIMLEHKVNTKAVMSSMGHKSLRMTVGRYGSVLPEGKQEVADCLEQVFAGFDPEKK
jgi:integrase